MPSMLLWWVSTSALAAPLPSPPDPPDRGGDGAADAGQGEYLRLAEEIEVLAARNAWGGVDRIFRQMLALGVRLRFDDWIRGAAAARALGDVGTARERLLAANAIQEDRSVLDALWDIDARFGSAQLSCDPGSWLVLESEDAPMDPDLARAIAFAKQQIAEDCAFDGLLPVGRYKLLDAVIDVALRQTAVLDLRGVEIPRAERRALRRAWREAHAEEAGR